MTRYNCDSSELLAPHRNKKRQLVNENIAKFYEDKEIDSELNTLIESSENENNKFNTEKFITETYNTKNSKHKKIQEKEFFRKNLQQNLFNECYSIIILESLPLSDSYKTKNAQSILNKCSSFLNGISSDIKLNEESIFYSISDIINTKTNNLNEEDNIDALLEEINEEIFDYKFYGSREFKKCIEETINNEIKISELKQNLNEESKYKYDLREKTLFRFIIEKNTTEINEDTNEMNGIDNDIFNESIVDYAILESINFFKVSDINKKDLRNNLKYIN